MNFSEFLIQERSSFPLFCPVLLSLGILTGVCFPFTNWQALCIFLAASLVISVLLRKIKISSFSVLLFALGIYVSQTGGILDTELLSNKKFIEQEYKKIKFFATVGFVEETHPTIKNMQRVIFKDMQFDKYENLSFIKTSKMTCSSKSLYGIKPQDRVRVTGSLLPYKPAAIPGSFDQAQYNSLIKMDTTGIVFYMKKVKSNNSESSSNIMENFSSARFWLTKAITRNIAKPAGGVAAALLTGDKSVIDNDVRDKFIKSGTAHILAISGLHMSILASILFFVFFRLFLYSNCFLPHLNAKKCAAVITIPCTFLYLALSGFSPSAIRAFIMTTVCLISITIGRGAISLRSVSFAGFLILLFDSASLFLVSFQLSFSAVVALISFYEKYSSTFARWTSNATFPKKAALYLATSSITTFVATVATLPISISTFNRLSLSSIFGNLIAIPLTSLVIAPLGIISLVFGYFTNFFTKLFEISINILITCISYVASMPGSDIALKTPSTSTLFIMILGGVVLCLLKTRLRHIGSFAICISLILYLFEKTPDIIIPPKANVVCFVKDGVFYSTSTSKGRNKVKSIQRNLGFSGEIKKSVNVDFSIEQKIYDQGLFLWTKNEKILKKRQLANKRHPYCPTFYENTQSD